MSKKTPKQNSSLHKSLPAQQNQTSKHVASSAIALSEEYKDMPFNWTINTSFLCNRDVCNNNCERDRRCFSLYELTKEKMFHIFEKLTTFRTWKWRDIERARNDVSCGKISISKLAEKKRVVAHLERCGLDNHDELYEMEITNHHRVWGVRDNNFLILLWNDPNHQFYETKNYKK